MHTESYINPSQEEYFGKTLMEKGFQPKDPSFGVIDTESIHK